MELLLHHTLRLLNSSDGEVLYKGRNIELHGSSQRNPLFQQIIKCNYERMKYIGLINARGDFTCLNKYARIKDDNEI